MKFLKWLILVTVFFVVLPTIATVALLKFTATPLVNALLKAKVNAPAKVEKVDTDWFLTKISVQNLVIENPQGFPKGDLLRVPSLVVDINPKTYAAFKPYITLMGRNIYLHFIRNSDNSTNIAVAFGLPIEKAKVSPLEFEIKNFNIDLKVNTLKEVTYRGNGKFVGLHNNSDFSFNGTGDLSDKNNPLTVTDFVVYDWKIQNNKYLDRLAQILNNPSLRNITLTKIEGRVKTEGPWVIFADRNTKAYTVGNVLFAEIYKGSKYNRITKQLDIRLALYLPMKVEIHITGTTKSPKIEVENLRELLQGTNLLPVNPQNKTNPTEAIKELPQKVKKVLEKPLKELQEKMNKALQGLMGN